MKGIPVCSGGRPTLAPRASKKLARRQQITRAVAAPELSPKEAGTAGAKNQLDALKQMSKIVADSGVRLQPCLTSCD